MKPRLELKIVPKDPRLPTFYLKLCVLESRNVNINCLKTKAFLTKRLPSLFYPLKKTKQKNTLAPKQ